MQYVSLEARQRKVRDNFYLLLSVLAPRPVTLLSTRSGEGRGNLAPYGHITIGGANPPSLVFCAMRDKHGELKHTARNVLDTGEFVVNICAREFIGRINETARSLPPEDNELEVYGFTPLPSVLVKPPRIAEAPVQLECRLHSTLGHGEGPLSSLYIAAEVVMFHVREEILGIDGQVDPQKFSYVGRLGMNWFCEVTPEVTFEVESPR
jgi:flavin reductase (DIM6/NTAB) family NADH-FMN oxidoreductase RutF